MPLRKRMVTYNEIDQDTRIKVALKYLKNPDQSIMRIPDEKEEKLIDVIEIWHKEEFLLVVVEEEDLKKIFWENYLETGDDGVFLPYFNNEAYGDPEDLFDRPVN